MITTDQIKEIINSLEHYNGSKWNIKTIYNYLRDEYNTVTYNPYCKSCGSCGHDGCCSAMNCKFDKNCKYKNIYLKDLHLSYLNAEDFYKLIYNTQDQKLINQMHYLMDNNDEIVYAK